MQGVGGMDWTIGLLRDWLARMDGVLDLHIAVAFARVHGTTWLATYLHERA